MLYVVVCVKDTASDVFSQPQYVAHVNQALRGFTDQVNEKPVSEQNLVARHPSDFFLFELGTFDDVTGKFSLLESPRQVARAADLVRS